MKKKNDEITIRSSAAEYLTYVASVGDQQDSIEMRYEDENIWLTQKIMATLYDVGLPTINEHSDSNIKVKSCEEPPSPQSCPFFLQKGQRLFLDLTDVQFFMHSTLLFWEIWIKTEKQFYYFFAFSSSSSMYLSKSDIKSLS